MKKFLKIRLLLLGLALLAVGVLTVMNIYSLYALHESTINATLDSQKNQLVEFTFNVRNRFRTPVEGIWRLNMEQLNEEFSSGQPLNKAFADLLYEASRDTLFDAVYFAHPDFERCQDDGDIYKFDPAKRDFVLASGFPPFICDGLGLTRTRMKVLIEDYRWNTKVLYDAHRTMTVALINPRGSNIVGFLTFDINENYLINSYFVKRLREDFGPQQNSGMTIWLHDWIRNEVLATNDPATEFNRREIQFTQRFPDLLDNWWLRVKFDENPTLIASRAQLTRNLVLLGAGVLLLISSLVIMFFLAQRERKLAERQSGFLANVTHELKTPVAVMQAAGENLADGRVTDPERLKTYGTHIHTEAVRLRKMIEKLLDVAKNDAGQLLVRPATYSVLSLVEDVLLEHNTMLKNKEFQVDIRITQNLPQVYVDKDSFGAILGNLIENAIKYSPDEKYLGISASKNGAYIRIDVEDRGLGIPQKSVKLIFDKFYRVEDPLTAKTKGHGLGLSIVKSLTELNGGKISVQSEYRKGSVFTVLLPISVVSDVRESITIPNESKVEYAN